MLGREAGFELPERARVVLHSLNHYRLGLLESRTYPHCLKSLRVGAIAVVIVGLGFGTANGQTPGSDSPSWGAPDLQGVWDFRTITPLERPEDLTGQEFLTEEEAAAYAEGQSRRQNRDLIDSAQGGLNYAPEADGGVVPYNEFWYDRGTSVISSRRTSLIIDPPDGRLPPLTPEGQRRAGAQRDIAREEQRGRPRADNPEDRDVGDRCIMGFNAGLPMVPAAYNNNVQLFQTSDYVVIFNEMVHNARIVPLDGRPHGTIRQWVGDSRGRWEGNTLVVDTINFYGETSLNGSGPTTHLVEPSHAWTPIRSTMKSRSRIRTCGRDPGPRKCL